MQVWKEKAGADYREGIPGGLSPFHCDMAVKMHEFFKNMCKTRSKVGYTISKTLFSFWLLRPQIPVFRMALSVNPIRCSTPNPAGTQDSLIGLPFSSSGFSTVRKALE